MTVLVAHDRGCKWARFDGEVDARARILSGGVRPGHTDAAKRCSDWYNLHKAAGQGQGWIGIALADGDSDGEVYEARGDAVRHQHHDEKWYFFARLTQPCMTVCQAESVLRWQRVMNEVVQADRDERDGGLEVIPRLTIEDMDAQVAAVQEGRGYLALGRRE